MLVGEQPGNEEDLAGKPFVGPAGRLLDEALKAAGIERQKAYVTNAVKHFKFVRRGKRRLHQRPSPDEVESCHGWLDQELRLVKPVLVMALGATAARSLFGKVMTIGASRGKILELPGGQSAAITVHPSYLLRIPDAARKKAEQERFISDLRRAKKFVDSET